ncbi:MAG: sulfatase-like hydrolase/transferase [SAR324 cluster bacterium]|uniref:Sulfatase-like hydrolase/transferase n=1 Tax=SAR324 cluster bacterium TaxID=2024889 RepID=A0A7X9IKQ8_9DELT|nr:sulfatase-like hydrolase/transferase [SAR324 cluster bacterium]
MNPDKNRYKSPHEQEQSPHLLAIGPLLIFTALSIYKSSIVANGLTALLWLSKVDLIFFGLLLLLVSLLAFAKNLFVRIFLHLLIILGLFAFQLQVISLTLFDMNLTLSNVIDFAPEWRWNLNFVKLHHILLFLLALLAYRVLWLRVSFRQLTALSVVALLISCVGLAPTKDPPIHLRKYVFDVRDFGTQTNGNESACAVAYPSDLAHAAMISRSKRQLLNLGSFEGRNIVLAIIESMSSVDSRRTSSIGNIFRRFDRISENGILFRNVFADYYQTSGGLVALFNGVPPLSYPKAKVPLLNAFDSQPSLPRAFADHGYKTIFLKNAPLAFENTRSYSRRIGFDFTAGFDEIERYRGKPTFTCGVVGDEHLMDESIQQVEELMRAPQPFFLSLLTTSSHVPWVDPLRRGDTEKNVFDYVDQQIERLYFGLERIGFFEKNGVLILTSDHRKPQPISYKEREKYGDWAKTRIPLLLIGKGIPKGGFDDRFLSQSDLFAKLESLLNPSAELSPYAIYVDHYSRLVWQDQPKSNFALFLPKDLGQREYSGTVGGTCLSWKALPPPNAKIIEQDIHEQRAAHQENFDSKAIKCNMQVKGEVSWQEGHNGVLMRAYRGTDMSGLLDEESPRFIGKQVLKNFSQIEPDKLGLPKEAMILEFETGVYIPEDGIYWFSIQSEQGGCLNVNDQIIIDANEDTDGGDIWGHAKMKRGPQRVLIRTHSTGTSPVRILWAKKPDRQYWTRSRDKQWVPVPDNYLFEPVPLP